MFKVIFAAGVLSLLAACSSMSGGGSTSSSAMSGTSSMGAAPMDTAPQGGYGPRGSSGGGPN